MVLAAAGSGTLLFHRSAAGDTDPICSYDAGDSTGFLRAGVMSDA
jgi:hypothetical protein